MESLQYTEGMVLMNLCLHEQDNQIDDGQLFCTHEHGMGHNFYKLTPLKPECTSMNTCW